MSREKQLEQALRWLIKIATGALEHDRAGQCPDAVEGHDARDENCAACKAVMRAERLLSEPAQAEQSERELPDYLKDALDNLVHDNYERSQAGSRNRQADADLIRAALATLPAQAEQTEQQPAYVECRECIDCGHVGINDAHPTDAKCAMCDWSGPSPVEDQCPDCGKENVMGAACPKCSGRYRILAETHVAAPIAPAPQQSGLVDLLRVLERTHAGHMVGHDQSDQPRGGYSDGYVKGFGACIEVVKKRCSTLPQGGE